MNYYEKFKDDAKQAVATSATNVETFAEQVSKIKKRMEEETANATELEKRIVILKEKAGESLVGDAKDYAEFKQSLSRSGAELDTSRELIETFNKQILPAKQGQLVNEQRKLASALTAFCQSKRPICEARITELVGEIVRERDAFLDGLERIHQDYNVSLKRNAPGVIPECLHERINKLSSGFVIKARTAEQRVKALAALAGAGR